LLKDVVITSESKTVENCQKVLKKVLILPLIIDITKTMHNKVVIKAIQTSGSKLKRYMNSDRTPGLVIEAMCSDDSSPIDLENSKYSIDINVEVNLLDVIGTTTISI